MELVGERMFQRPGQPRALVSLLEQRGLTMSSVVSARSMPVVQTHNQSPGLLASLPGPHAPPGYDARERGQWGDPYDQPPR
jgi:hypothetical protein